MMPKTVAFLKSVAAFVASASFSKPMTAGLRLPAGFKISHSERFEFAYEKAQLLKILEADWKARTADDWKPHPMFGKMTPKEWGKLLQIHVDYHLRQFAA